MTTHIVSASMQAKAEALADQAHTWNHGRSKIDGSGFYLVPTSDDPENTAHRCSRLGCTCKGHRRHGVCTHQLACQIVDRRANAAMVAEQDALRRAKSAATWERLYPEGDD